MGLFKKKQEPPVFGQRVLVCDDAGEWYPARLAREAECHFGVWEWPVMMEDSEPSDWLNVAMFWVTTDCVAAPGDAPDDLWHPLDLDEWGHDPFRKDVLAAIPPLREQWAGPTYDPRNSPAVVRERLEREAAERVFRDMAYAQEALDNDKHNFGQTMRMTVDDYDEDIDRLTERVLELEDEVREVRRQRRDSPGLSPLIDYVVLLKSLRHHHDALFLLYQSLGETWPYRTGSGLRLDGSSYWDDVSS